MKPDAALAMLCAFSASGALASCSAGVDANSVQANRISRDLPRLTVDARLREMGPDGWHHVALHGNWDFIEPEVWRWIAVQPDCDRATALAIFWMARPEYYVEFADRASVPEVNRDGFDLIMLIRDRWRSGAYTRSELAFERDADTGPVDLAALERQYGDRVTQVIPASMRVDLRGRRVARDGPPLPGNLGR